MTEKTSHTYYTIGQSSEAEYKDRGSRFIAVSLPVQSVDEFKEKLAEVKQKYPKANHYCFAYVLGVDGNIYRSSDDGEPAGTAGKPILNQIRSKNLVNVAVIVIRYFGGTLLGTSGLIQAYKQVASFVLQSTPLIRKQIELQYKIECDYLKLDEVLRILQSNGCTVHEKKVELFCQINALVPAYRFEEITNIIKAIPGVTVNLL
jgi:uncharacterized YigZ family protein